MRLFWIRGKILASLLFLFLGVVVLAACGSNPSTTGSSLAPSAATATACAGRAKTAGRAATGTLQSINGTTLVIATQQGKNVTVTYSSSTSFAQESIIPATSLKEGTYVTVAGSNANNTYTATRITEVSVTSGFPKLSGTPGAGRFSGSNPCSIQKKSGSGQPGSTNNFRGLVGTVSQVSSNSLTLTDTSGANYSVAITAQTQIVGTSSVTAAVLKTGMALTVTGTTGGNGVVSARTVTILLKLPTSTK